MKPSVLQSQQPKLLLSIRETCQAVGLSHVSVYHEIAAGRLASCKIGRRRLITPEAIRAWISDRERATCGGGVR